MRLRRVVVTYGRASGALIQIVNGASPGDGLAATVKPTLAERYGQWDFFEYLAGQNILQIEEELNVTKRVPR